MRKYLWVSYCVLYSVVTAAYAETLGLVSGAGSQKDYAAFVESDFTLNSFAPFSTNAVINSIALNYKGYGLVGGLTSLTYPIAAQIFPHGRVRELDLVFDGPLPQGIISQVAINYFGVGIIGGSYEDGVGGKVYAALVSPEGQTSRLPVSDRVVRIGESVAVAINNWGACLIGVPVTSSSALWFRSHTGEMRDLSEQLRDDFLLQSVAINDLNKGLIGGIGSRYPLAVVSKEASVTPLYVDEEGVVIRSVALNDFGKGIVGGGINAPLNIIPYVARVLPDNTVHKVGSLPPAGAIYSVAMNNADWGLIGGESGAFPNTAPYAAFVLPEGDARALSLPGGVGRIKSVALHMQGFGLIGGYTGPSGSTHAYAAIVSPRGDVTELSPLSQIEIIQSVALADPTLSWLAMHLIPSSVGSYNGPIYAQFAAGQALALHMMQAKPFSSGGSKDLAFVAQSDEVGHTAAQGSLDEDEPDGATPTTLSPAGRGTNRTFPYTVWATPFGSFVQVDHAQSVPKYTNAIGGTLVGFDYHSPALLLGGALGYAYNRTHYKPDIGHGTIHEELACFYSSCKVDGLWIDTALWGGVYELHNDRHFLGVLSSFLSTTGWILSPHVQVSFPYDLRNYRFEPFISFDWTNAWQRHYTEQGKTGFHLVMPGQWATVLQSEIGYRFYETLTYNWGQCRFEQKLSYVNQAPLHCKTAQTFFVGAPITFPVATGSTKVQNLGAVQLSCSFTPKNQKYPYGIVNFEGQFGSSLQSYFGSIEIGESF